MQTAKVYNNLACIYLYLGDYNKSFSLFTEALHILTKNYGEKTKDATIVLANLGNLYRLLNKITTSETMLKQALLQMKGAVAVDNIYRARIIADLGLAYRDLNNRVMAQKCLQDALVIFKKHLPNDHLDIVNITRALESLNVEFKRDNKLNALGYPSLFFL
jgi:tetratricopeptide (TPR) repeat protein